MGETPARRTGVIHRGGQKSGVTRVTRKRPPPPAPAAAHGRPDLCARVHATNAPHALTIVTRPSAARTRTARAAVVRLTPYSAARAVADGSCSPVSHSPASSRARSAAATARYGTCGVLGIPSAFPAEDLATTGLSGLCEASGLYGLCGLS